MMKKTILFLTLLTALAVSGDSFSFRLHQGIPLGDWAYDVNSGNDISVFYLKDIGSISVPAGISLSSLQTDSYYYRINIASFQTGIQYRIYNSGQFSLFLCHTAGFSLIEKRLFEYSESGFRESFDNALGASYKVGSVSFSMLLNYKRIGVIEGADYISFCAAIDILSSGLFR